MTALPPGPQLRELDAKLHRLLGRKVCSNVDCDGCDASMYLTGRGWVGGDRYSTDVSAAISAAEEAKIAGRIHAWDIYSGPAHPNVGVKGHAAGIWTREKDGIEKLAQVGDSPAHALSLALCAALER